MSTAQAEADFLRQSHLGTNDDEIGDDIPVYCGAARAYRVARTTNRVECAACSGDFDFLPRSPKRLAGLPGAPRVSMPKYVRMSTKDYGQTLMAMRL